MFVIFYVSQSKYLCIDVVDQEVYVIIKISFIILFPDNKLISFLFSFFFTHSLINFCFFLSLCFIIAKKVKIWQVRTRGEGRFVLHGAYRLARP